MGRGSSSGLVEREAQLALLEDTLDGAAAGEGASALLEGAPGLGKTTLLGALRAIALERGFIAAYASSAEGQASIGHDLVRKLIAAVVEQHPVPVPLLTGSGAVSAALAMSAGRTPTLPDSLTPDGDAAAALQLGAWTIIRAATDRSPLLLLADDLQWADEASLRMLAYFGRRVAGERIAVIGAVRSTDERASHPLVSAVRSALGQPLIDVPALSRTGTQTLAANLGVDGDRSFGRKCHELTAGNPLYLKQLISDVGRRMITPTAADLGAMVHVDSDQWAHQQLAEVRRLGAAAQCVVDAASILSEEAGLRLIAAITERPMIEVAATADALRARGILTSSEQLEFSHPLLRHAAYASLDPDRRVDLHCRAADVLYHDEAPAPTTANHLLSVPAQRGPEWAFDLLVQAGYTELGHGAGPEAVRWLTRALEERTTDEDARASITAALSSAHFMSGDRERAAEVMRAAVELQREPRDRVTYLIQLGMMALDPVNWDVGVRVLSEAEDLARSTGHDDLVMATSSARLAFLAVARSQEIITDAGLDQFQDLPGENPIERRLLSLLAYRSWLLQRPRGEILDLARRGLAEGKIDATEVVASPAFGIGAYATLMVEDDTFTESFLAHLRRSVVAVGFPWALAGSSSFSAMFELSRGFPLAAAFHIDHADSVTAGQDPTLTYFLHLGAKLEVLAETGRCDEAAAAFFASGWSDAIPPLVLTNNPARAWGLVLAASGEDEQAYEQLLLAGHREQESGVRCDPLHPWRLDAAEVAWRLGNPAKALEHAAEQRQVVGPWAGPRALAMVDSVLGFLEPNVTLASEAADALSPYGLHGARAQLHLARAHLSVGDRAEAIPVFQAAIRQAERVGGETLARRARQELHAFSDDALRQFVLTADELRVANLAAAGKTNREIAADVFLSPKTIEKRLGRIYAKLGISGRTELPAALGASADTPPEQAL